MELSPRGERKVFAMFSREAFHRKEEREME